MNASPTPGALLRRGLALNAGSVVSAHALNFARYAVVARLLPLDAFGLFAMVNVGMLAAQMLSNWGWRSAYIAQQAAGDDPARRLRTLWTADLLVRATAAALLCLASPLLARAFDQPQLTALVMVSALYVLAQGLRHPALMDRERHLDFRLIAVVEVSGAVSGLLVAVAAAWLLGNVWALVLGQAVSGLVPALLSHMLIAEPARPLLDRALVRQGFGFSRSMLGISALVWVMSQADNALVGAALGASLLGLFALAYRLCEIPKVLQDTIITRTVYPFYVKALADGAVGLGRAWTQTGRYTLWLLWFAYLPMLLVPELLLVVLFGEPWRPAADTLRILAAAGLLRGVNTFLTPVFMALQRPGLDLRIRVVEALVFIAIASWGAWAVGSLEAVALAGVGAWGLGLVARLVLACGRTDVAATTLLATWRAPLLGLGTAVVAAPLLLALPPWPALAALLALLGALLTGLERDRLRQFRR